ncbi:SGNH/GDSL hydrolase family protein [Hymenobacter aerilatus]|uniref:SGNH/GDSL hydrolase family protein n=1 Tax=Hymenobacter aerilatus TaxID=2932251 RepID=A0A8T9SX55_9BACT|nr:SGNH/GDSL hydrolase family protein [Hymenobacter aerilatus]UOR06317.1 SGNH/GDSL hydrolase family protein [Hymenobacter aerilatus]
MKTLPLLTLAFSLLTTPLLAQQNPDWANLKRYTPANQQLKAPSTNTPRVVLMGNSITDAWPRADSAFFAGRPYEYVGRGIGGQTSPQMLLRFRQDVLNLRPAVVAILSGTNDVAENTGPYDQQATMNNIKSMAELAQANGVRVILCSVLPASEFPWRKGLTPGPKIVALNEQIKAYAQQHNFVYLDYHKALADERQGLPAKYANDGVHPTLAGYRIMEPLLNQAVAKALKQKSK